MPGTPGLEHRIGGIEKDDGTGIISYDGRNHEHMVAVRAAKVAGIDVPDLVVEGDPDAEVLVIGWGSTYGPIHAAVRTVLAKGLPIAQVHLRHLNPFPANTGEVLRSYRRVLLPEMNTGQLAMLLRATYLVNAERISKVQGQPFRASGLAEVFEEAIRNG